MNKTHKSIEEMYSEVKQEQSAKIDGKEVLSSLKDYAATWLLYQILKHGEAGSKRG